MRISDRIYLVGGGRLGAGISHQNDCNVYAIDCGAEIVLIDAGTGRETQKLLSNLVADGADLKKLKYLLLTHGHLDHSGGARFLHDELGLQVWASQSCANALETGNEEAISLGAAKAAGVYPEDFKFQACPVDRKLSDGEKIQFSEATVQVIATPGHSHDMVSFLFQTAQGGWLFSGDTIFHGGRIVLSAVYDCDVQQYIASLRKLRHLAVDGLFPGHGLWVLSGAASHLKAATDYLDRLLLPPNLI